MDDFASGMAVVLPFNAAMGLNWADAHIGRFPRFGVGISGGFTTLDFGPFSNLLDMLAPGVSEQVTTWGGFPLPGVILEGRLGGFFLPFDIGAKVGFLPTSPDAFDRLDYFSAGADIRYAVLEQGRIVPAISLGVGLNHLSGGVSRGLGDQSFTNTVDIAGTPVTQTINVTGPSLEIDWATTTIDLKAQISRSLAIVTPYIGFGASHGWSRVSYGLNAGDISSPDLPNLDELREVLGGFGIDTSQVDSVLSGFSSETSILGWGFRLFGGVSFNLPLIRLDLTGMWNLSVDAPSYGVTLGARLQI